MLARMIVVGLVVIALVGVASQGHAQVSVSIGINLPAPPSLVIIPSTPVAYAPAVPANYFFYGGEYYVFNGGAWYVGPRYNGPWVVVAPEYIPMPLLTVPVRYYRAPPGHWKQLRREAVPAWDPAWGEEWRKANKEREKEWKKAVKEQDKEMKKISKEQEKEAKEAKKPHH